MSGFVSIVLSNVLGAGLLALVAVIVGRFVRRPAITHAIWLLVLVKLVTPPIFTVDVPFVPRWLSSLDASAQHVSPTQITVVAFDTGHSAQAWATSVPPAVTAAQPAGQGIVSSPLAWLLGLWGVGSLCYYSRTLRKLWRFGRLLRESSRAHPDLQAECVLLAQQIGMRWAPEVWLSPGATPPLVWKGTGTVRIYIPEALLDSLDQQERASVIVHELAHIRRRDHLVRWFEVLVLGLYWWNPVAWVARRQLQKHEEECCDAWVVEQLPARSYATAILATVDFLSESDEPLPGLASGLHPDHPLRSRLVRILGEQPSRRFSWLGGCALLVLGMLLPVLPVLSEPVVEPAPEPQVVVQLVTPPKPENPKPKAIPPKEEVARPTFLFHPDFVPVEGVVPEKLPDRVRPVGNPETRIFVEPRTVLGWKLARPANIRMLPLLALNTLGEKARMHLSRRYTTAIIVYPGTDGKEAILLTMPVEMTRTGVYLLEMPGTKPEKIRRAHPIPIIEPQPQPRRRNLP